MTTEIQAAAAALKPEPKPMTKAEFTEQWCNMPSTLADATTAHLTNDAFDMLVTTARYNLALRYKGE